MLKQRLSLATWCVIFTVIVCSTDGSPKPALRLHHRMTKTELKKFFGVNSHDQVPDYEIAQSFLTDQVKSKKSPDSPGQKSYTLKSFGSSMQLDLNQDRDVIAPNMVVRSHHVDGSRTESNVDDIRLYSGHVTGHPGSRVLVKDSNGLSGQIEVQDQTYFVRPLPGHLAKAHGYSGAGQPHVVYRRSVTNDKTTKHFQEMMQNGSESKSESSHKVMEIMLLADPYVIGAYGNETVEHLLLSAHITRGLFLDRSIGPIKINLLVVGIVLKKDGFGYKHDAPIRDRMGAAGEWADKNLPKLDSDPGHPDTVVLVSRGVAGLALLNSTCFKNTFGLVAVGDQGLTTSTLIAHEIAHTFGVDHDGDICPNSKYIMSTVAASGTGAFTWSNCSRDAIQSFLRGPKSNCFNDEPSNNAPIPKEPAMFHDKLPGQIVNRDAQCRMLNGKGYFTCPHDKIICSTLMCTDDKDSPSCTGQGTPPADGTSCGPRNWCIKGECVDNGSPITHGMWSNWSNAFSRCSRTCGGGVRWRTRTCTNPRPENGGKLCRGFAEGHWKLCNTKECRLPGSVDYRLQQCKAFDSTYDSVDYGGNPCFLRCQRGVYSWFYGYVNDGTRCSNDHAVKDVCIKGVCRITGCDGNLDSGVKFDRCRVCNGNSSTCGMVSGVYDAPCAGHGYKDECVVLNVPVGARSVRVEKKVSDINSYIGIRNSRGRFVTTRFPSWSEHVDVAGTRVHYYREPSDFKDRVFIPGPTTEPLVIVNVPTYNKANKGIDYSLFLTSKTTVVNSNDVQWRTSRWSACTKTCAGGSQSRTVECVRKDDGSYVASDVCKAASSAPAVNQACNAQACLPSWHTFDWLPCTKSCGKGVQTRQIACRQDIPNGRYELLPDSICSGSKPADDVRRECNKIACPEQWVATTWSQCSVTCGAGTMARSLKCKRRNSQGNMVRIHHLICANIPRPATVKPCNKNICPTTPGPTTQPSPTTAPSKRYGG